MTTDDPLDQKVVQLARAFESAGLPYAMGGALAFAYCSEPATMDVDINVFVRPTARRSVRRASLGVTAHPRPSMETERGGQVRLHWELRRLISSSPATSSMITPRRGETSRSATSDRSSRPGLLVCKTVFDRRKDWIDIDLILALTAGDLDLDDVRRWVTHRRSRRCTPGKGLEAAIAGFSIGNYRATPWS
jgi:hypothetical protein